jgi:hypothetical protein
MVPTSGIKVAGMIVDAPSCVAFAALAAATMADHRVSGKIPTGLGASSVICALLGTIPRTANRPARTLFRDCTIRNHGSSIDEYMFYTNGIVCWVGEG